MNAILIKTDSKSNLKILSDLARKLGSRVLSITEDQMEDLSLGLLMDKAKTGENVSRDEIFKKLKKR